MESEMIQEKDEQDILKKEVTVSWAGVLQTYRVSQKLLLPLP